MTDESQFETFYVYNKTILEVVTIIINMNNNSITIIINNTIMIDDHQYEFLYV